MDRVTMTAGFKTGLRIHISKFQNNDSFYKNYGKY